MSIQYLVENSRSKMNNAPTIRRSLASQDRLKIFANSPSNQDTLASGDTNCTRCCRLCGGDTSLKYFKDSYVWEGTEERYDQLLYDCFGIKVTPSDCMICERCIRALRNTEKFRALVFAAFDQASTSDLAIYVTSSDKTIKTNSCQTTSTSQETQRATKHAQPKRKQYELARRREARKTWMRPEEKNKRVNVQCVLCKQRYPMLISNGECKSFTCSRCKKKGETKRAICRKCNIAIPTHMVKEHMDLHAKANLRGKARPRQIKNVLTPVYSLQPKEKLPGIKCKKYTLVNHTEPSMRKAHGFSNDNFTAGKKNTRQKLERQQVDTDHHDSENGAIECKLLFKNVQVNSVRHNVSTL